MKNEKQDRPSERYLLITFNRFPFKHCVKSGNYILRFATYTSTSSQNLKQLRILYAILFPDVLWVWSLFALRLIVTMFRDERIPASFRHRKARPAYNSSWTKRSACSGGMPSLRNASGPSPVCKTGSRSSKLCKSVRRQNNPIGISSPH